MEFMPFKKDMNCIKQGLEVFRSAGCKNGGFCLDSWHTLMGPSSYDDISLIKPEEIIHVELDDGYMTALEISWVYDRSRDSSGQKSH